MTTLFQYGTRCLYEDINFYSVLIVRSASMGVGRIFSRGGTRGFFPGAKVVKFVFSHSKVRIQPFIAKKFQNAGEGQGHSLPPLATPFICVSGLCRRMEIFSTAAKLFV